MRLKALGEAYRRRLDFIVEVPWGDNGNEDTFTLPVTVLQQAF